MYLTLTSTAPAASDLGYLLHKNPGRAQSFELPVGRAHVFYPEASDQRCTVALLLEVDPVALVRGKHPKGDGQSSAQYVNDRPYAASSMLAVALAGVFRTAMSGRCTARPDLEGVPLPLEVQVPSLPSDGGADLVSRLFAPLGWSVETTVPPLEPAIPAWGPSRYVDLRLHATMLLDQALSHLYVLLPVLDDAKHYWVTSDEVDKLLRAGGQWLAEHPERELITRRYLKHQRSLVTDAVERLPTGDDADAALADAPGPESLLADSTDPAPVPLARLRRAAVLAELVAAGGGRVVDLGCGEGALLRELLADPSFTEVLGVDVSARELERAERRLALERMPDQVRSRLTLRQSSLTYRDTRLTGYDAAVLMEVIEHVDLVRLPSLERSVFGAARPRTVIVTTPNVEYNVRYGLLDGARRHPDHRFEWTRAEFETWGRAVAAEYGYRVRFSGVGEPDEQLGSPTQLAVFSMATESAAPETVAPEQASG